jgi:hypothetical protein
MRILELPASHKALAVSVSVAVCIPCGTQPGKPGADLSCHTAVVKLCTVDCCPLRHGPRLSLLGTDTAARIGSPTHLLPSCHQHDPWRIHQGQRPIKASHACRCQVYVLVHPGLAITVASTPRLFAMHTQKVALHHPPSIRPSPGSSSWPRCQT